MKRKIREILDSFLPAMEKIQGAKASDEEKKQMAKEWLRSKLNVFLEKTGTDNG